jgi:HD-GYP domain-containing protein (c-di-GMP phosphodiesterase class II)
LEQQLASFKSHQIGHLTQIDELRKQLATEQNQRNQILQQQNIKSSNLERTMQDTQVQLQQARQKLQIKEAEVNVYQRDLQKKQAEIQELQQAVKNREESISESQSKLKEEFEQFKRSKDEEINSKQIEISHYKNQFVSAREQAKSLEQERNKLLVDMERMQQIFQRQQQELEFQNAELKQKVQDQPPFFPVKFEEDILLEIAMRSELSKDELKLKRLIKLVQVIDFFDLSKPDGQDVRNMFLSDQGAQRREGKQVLIATSTDLEAFDHFSRAIRGSQQNISNREVALIDGVRKLQKLLSNSNEEVIPGISYQSLSEQISELGSSTVYLTGRTQYPFRDDDTAFLTFTNTSIKSVPSSLNTHKADVEPTYVITSASPSKKRHEGSSIIEYQEKHTSYSNDFNLKYNVTVPALPSAASGATTEKDLKGSPQRGVNSWSSKQTRTSWAEESVPDTTSTTSTPTDSIQDNSQTLDTSPVKNNYQPRKQYRGPRRGKGSVNRGGGSAERGTFRGGSERGNFRGGFRGKARKPYTQNNDVSSANNVSSDTRPTTIKL